MRSNHRLIVLTMSAMLLLSVVGAGLAMADDDLTVSVEQADDVTVTVTDDESAVGDAAVNVSVIDENASYAGAGDHVTDENGTVDLPAPDETVNVSITAEKDNSTGHETTLLEADSEEVTDGESDAFGLTVSDFVHELIQESEGPIGHHVAEYVTDNNPGNAPDHAGPSDDAGPPEHAGPDGEKGPSEDGEAEEDDVETGDAEADDEEDVEEDEEEEAEEDEEEDAEEDDDNDDEDDDSEE